MKRLLLFACCVLSLTGVARPQSLADTQDDGYQFPKRAVSKLPKAQLSIGRTVQVIDGQSSSDCTAGGGSYSALCVSQVNPSTGLASWVALSSTGGVSALSQTGTGSTSVITDPGNLAANPVLPFPYSQVTAWGDSITFGIGETNGNTYPAILSGLSGFTVSNQGNAGQTTDDGCVRMGFCPTTITLTSSLGTASGSTATFTVPAGPDGGFGYRACFGETNPGVVLVAISGIPGSCVDNGSGASYTFTSSAASAGLATGSYTYNGTPGSLLNGLNIIELGTNNLYRPATVIQDIGTIVTGIEAIPGADYVILSPMTPNAEIGWNGNQYNQAAIAVSAYLQAHYPGHYVEIRERLVDTYDPTSQLETVNFQNDQTPNGDRAVYTGSTLSANMTDTTSCPAPLNGVTAGTLLAGFETHIDGEWIYDNVVSGSTISDCIRGYGGTTATTHTAGAAVTNVDAIHLNSGTGGLNGTGGYTYIANWVYQWMQSDAANNAATAFLPTSLTLSSSKLALATTQPPSFTTRYNFATGSDGTANSYKNGYDAGFNFYLGPGGGVNQYASGANALYSNRSGSNNSCGGTSCLFNLNGTNGNTALGYHAGAYIADNATPNTGSSNSTFFGDGTRPLADNQTNQNVYGHNTVGGGSNTTTLSGAGTTDVYSSTSTVSQPNFHTGNVYSSGTNCSTGVLLGNGTGCVNPITNISFSDAPGDLICAVGTANVLPDNTINQTTVTGVSSTSSAITLTSAGFFGFQPGQTINANITATPANVSGSFVIASISAVGAQTTMVLTSSANPCSSGSCSAVSGTVNAICTNSADATGFQSFSNEFLAFPIAANTFARIQALIGDFAPSASPAPVNFHLNYNGQTVYASGSAMTPNVESGSTPAFGSFGWSELGLSSSTAIFTPSDIVFPSSSYAFLAGSRTGYGVASSLTTNLPLIFQVSFSSTGVNSGTYTSGGTITGTTGQTCTLATFNDSSTATATVALTGTNTIAGGTALVMTAHGAAATAAPTTATLGSGTATCSGTATITTVLGPSPGNGIELYGFGRSQ